MKQGGKASGGFTIVETLIVLAVTGMLFASAVLLINGRQNKTEFLTAVNNLQQQLQQIINQTTSGYYPNAHDFKCLHGTPPTIDGTGSNVQGTNGDCTFLGSVIYFGPGQSPAKFSVYPLAGNRLDTASKTVTTLAAAWPVALAQGNLTNGGAPNDDYTSYTMEGGLSYVWGPNPLPLNNPLAIGVITSVGGDASPATTGSQQFRLYGFTNSWAGIASSKDIVDKINKATTSTSSTAIIPWAGPLRACIASGTTKQSALISISQSLQVSLVIKNGTVCA